MKRGAFTLVELLIVIAIIGLLVAMTMPGLQRGKRLARKVVCAHNLHMIHAAFSGVGGSGGSPAKPYPHADAWPATPMDVVSTQKMYECPEQPAEEVDINGYYIYSNVHGGTEIPFRENKQSGLCRLIEDNDEYSLWGFEDGFYPDLWTGTVDIYIKVTKQPPITGIHMSDHYQGASDPRGQLSLYYRGRPVPGWEDFRNVPKGETFEMQGGLTSYGINANVHHVEVAPDTAVLLDYDLRVANRGEDVMQHLVTSARHLGKLNVLKAGGSVRSYGPTELNPTINPDIWTPEVSTPPESSE